MVAKGLFVGRRLCGYDDYQGLCGSLWSMDACQRHSGRSVVSRGCQPIRLLGYHSLTSPLAYLGHLGQWADGGAASSTLCFLYA